MKTRIANILTIILISAAFGCARAQDFRPPEWTMMVKVVDEGNQPITNASVKVWWHIPPPEGQSIAMTNVTGFSGEDGKFVISDRSGSIEVICEATKDGYYGSRLNLRTWRTPGWIIFRASSPSSGRSHRSRR